MSLIKQITKHIIIGSTALVLCFLPVCAQDSISHQVNSPILHRLSADFRPEYVFQSNSFLRGENQAHSRINTTYGFHLAYSFQYNSQSEKGRIYGNPYQGVGVGVYNYNSPKELGTPVAFYVFQGARIAQFTSRLSLNYEWNFGVSCGWHPYNAYTNPNNGGVGTKRNAYINAGIYLNTRVNNHIDIIAGATFSHFSNGNTKYPNAGINNGGLRVGVAYYFNRDDQSEELNSQHIVIPPYRRHISYDFLVYGSWRRKGAAFEDRLIAVPGHYPVFGFSFSPMYNLGYRFRVGLSLDGVYDDSANIRIEEMPSSLDDINIPNIEFIKTSFARRLSLGMALRAEYVMPYFTINLGMGNNFLYSHGDRKGFYQQLSLKIDVYRGTYLNVGYTLQDFSEPNFLMLGIGYRLK